MQSHLSRKSSEIFGKESENSANQGFSMGKGINMTHEKIYLGAAYYPEHWTEDTWAEDIRLMKEADFNVVRVGEFAWSKFEPSESDYRFEWLDRAIEMLAGAGIETVMGTPTAAPPAWMIQEYPETLRTGPDGRKVQFGNRVHYCNSSPQYHDFTGKIVHAMAEHYADNPHVIGWQIDNEFGSECYCDLCRSEFHRFLKREYGTLENLNQRWTTAYWSQTYSDWAQIELPVGSHNPGLMMAYRKFFTKSYQRYQKLQIDVIREAAPAEQWITHNFYGWFNRLDHYKMAQDLDMASYDYYVGSGHNDRVISGMKWDMTRSLKQKNFWLMETQPGSVNWAPTSNQLNKGECRAIAWQAIGHGCDAVLYWQWRSALNGQEQYHGTLIDQSGQPRPFYEEVTELGDDLKNTGEILADTIVPQNPVAILNDFESRWSLEHNPHHADFDYLTELSRWYRPFQENSIGVDIISPEADLKHYRLVVVPHMAVLDEEREQALKSFVEEGGNLIVTCRTGFKDHNDALLPARPPGKVLSELLGVEVEEYYSLDRSAALKAKLFRGSAQKWAEKFKIVDEKNVATMASYECFNGWLDDQPALTSRDAGRGTVYYVGCVMDDAALRKFVNHVLNISLIHPVFKELPVSVEICTRMKPDGEKVTILINHSSESQIVPFPEGYYEHITQEHYKGEVNMPPYSVAVLSKQESETGT